MSCGGRGEDVKYQEDSESATTAPLSSPFHSSRVGSPELRVLHDLLDDLDTARESLPSHSSSTHVEGDHLLDQVRVETTYATKEKAEEVNISMLTFGMKSN